MEHEAWEPRPPPEPGKWPPSAEPQDSRHDETGEPEAGGHDAEASDPADTQTGSPQARGPSDVLDAALDERPPIWPSPHPPADASPPPWDPEPPAAEPPAAAAPEEAAPDAVDGQRSAVTPAIRGRFDRAVVVAIANQKGGVGKTTTAVSVAAATAEVGSRVLLVDLDPQGNATSGIGMRARPDQRTVYHVLADGIDMLDVIVATNLRNLYLVPSSIDLAGAELELVSAFSREQKLARALEPVREEFDVIFIDCGPSLGLLTVNALTAADGIVVPIQTEYYALEGLGALTRNVDLVRANLNPALEIIGCVLTMLDARTRLSQQVVDEVRRHFGGRVFSTKIPRSVRLAEAPGFGQPITAFDPSSRGAMAYRRLAEELLDRLEALSSRQAVRQGGIA